MSNYDYKGTLLSNIFQSGTTQFADYTNLGTPLQFSSIFPNLPTQTLGYANTINDIGAACCPRFSRYFTNGTHICNAAATGVYLIAIGGGGGGGSGGSTATYVGDGGGGGGGGGMLALKVSKSNNPTITTPIVIVINIGAKGDGGLKRSSHGAGLNGTSGGATTATIICSGNDIVGTAFGGGFGRGGENLNNGLVDATGGAGGSRGISLVGGTVNYSNDNSNNGAAGLGGEDGTGPDNDISAGGAGGLNGYTTKGFFLIEDSTRGNGGDGGIGNTTAVAGSGFGGPGVDGRPGAVYVFEYFD